MSSHNGYGLQAGPSNASLFYERAAERARSPSPGPSNGYSSRGRYSGRGSPRRGMGANANPIRPRIQHLEQSYHVGIPSPERYAHSGNSDTNSWERPMSWGIPDSASWPLRRSIRDSIPDDPWPRSNRDTMAERMFEPSDSWKQTHTEPSEAPGSDRSYNPYTEPLTLATPVLTPQRAMRDHYSPPRGYYSPPRDHYSPPRNHYSPPRDHYSSPNHYSPPRNHYSPPHDPYVPHDHYSPPPLSGDRYRPYTPPAPAPAPPVRYPYMNPRSDSYRPQYDDDSSLWSPYPEEPYANRSGGRFSDGPYRPRARTPPNRRDRHFRGHQRSPSAGSSPTTSVYSPTTARVHSPPRISSSIASSAPIKVEPTSRQIHPLPPKPVAVSSRSSRSRSSSRSSEVPGLIKQQKTKTRLLSGRNDNDSIASTPHDERSSFLTLAKATPAVLDRKIDQPDSPPSDDIPGLLIKEEVQDLGKPPGLHQAVANVGITDHSMQLASSRDTTIEIPPVTGSLNPTSHQEVKPSTSPSLEAAISPVTIDHVKIEQPSDAARFPKKPYTGMEESDMEMSIPPSPVDVTLSSEGPPSTATMRSPSQLIERLTDIASSRSPTPTGSDMDMSAAPSPARRSSSPEHFEVLGDQIAHIDQHISDHMQSMPEGSESKVPISPRQQTKLASEGVVISDDKMSHEQSLGERAKTQADESDMEMSPPVSPVRAPFSRDDGHDHMFVSHARTDEPAHTASADLLIPRVGSFVPERQQSDLITDSLTSPERPLSEAPVEASPLQTVDLASGPDLGVVTSPQANYDATSFSAADTIVPDSMEVEAIIASPVDRSSASVSAIPDKGSQSESHHPLIMERAISDADSSAHDAPAPPSARQVGVIREQQEGAPDDSAAQVEKPLADALRLVVMTRLRCDRQTKQERVEPILLANLAIAESPHPPSSPDAVIRDVLQGDRLHPRQDVYSKTKFSLQTLFAQRQAVMIEKVRKLREEYLSLHERWLIHCAKLDEVAKAAALEEAAATAGRTTRRSAAMGDAVRTDLEMEQIIASLGNEELTDANHLAARNAASIPDMVSVEQGSIRYTYDDTNNVVDDPASFYTPNTGLEDWTEEEKNIFLEKYALYPKQFGIIADFLPHKTAAQCVTFYYLHKKSFIDFRKVVARLTMGKRKRGGRRTDKKKGNALLTDIRKHDDEVSRDSTPTGPTTRRRRGAQLTAPEVKRSRRSVTQVENSPISTPTPEPESRRRRRTTKPTARAVAAMEQQVDEDLVDPEVRPAKRGRKSRRLKSAETVLSPAMSEEMPVIFNETRFIDQTEMTARKKSSTGNVHWSEEDKELFLHLLAQHGDDFKRIAASMPNKTTIQVSVFYKANSAELNLAKVAASAPKRSPSPDAPLDIWKETTFPGSGMMTPSTAASTPSVGHQPPMSAPRSDSQMRISEPPTRRSHRRDPSMSSHRERRAPSAPSESVPALSSNSFQFRPTSVESMRVQYGGPATSDNGPRVYHPIQPRPTHMASMVVPQLDTVTGDPMRNPAAPLTMTFQSSLSYSNLSPSHFSGESRLPPRAVPMRGVTPPSAPASTTMTFDAATMFAPPQSWGFGPYSNGDGAGPSSNAGMPVALQTTDDLVAYLEHRTRFAEQRPSDFM